MKKFNNSIGTHCKRLARKFLERSNYKIIQYNFSCRYGEVDIIALDKDVLCFIEVKSRFSLLYGSPREAVTCFKLKKLYKCAEFFILKHNISNINCRIDVIEVYFNYNNNLSKINHLKNVI